MMSSDEIRARLENQVGNLSDDMWAYLVDEYYVKEVCDGQLFLEDLVEKTRQLLSIWGGRPVRKSSRKSASSDQAAGLLRSGETDRALALYEYFGRLADPMAGTFRAEVLGSRLMDDASARDWLRSDGVAQFPLRAFTSTGMSPTEDLGRIDIDKMFSEEKDGALWECVTVRFDSKGIELTAGRPIKGRRERLLLAYPDLTGTVARVVVHEESVLYDLRWVAQELTKRLPWEEHQAAWFVLTGAVPIPGPVKRTISRTRSADFTHHVLTLTVEPWVSAETVTRAFRSAQRKMLGDRENRPLGATNLQIFRFCVQHMGETGGLPPWPVLMRRWNERHPEELYADLRTFARDFNRARGQIAFPNYGEPW